MKRTKFVIPLLVLAGMLAGTAFGQVVVNFPLEGSQEVPPADTANSGECSGWLNSLRSEYTIACTNNADPVLAHIHNAAAGVNGPIVFYLEPTTDFQLLVSQETFTEQQECVADRPDLGGLCVNGKLQGLADITFEEFLAALEAGELYVNVHTMAFPGGELRGQIPPPPVETYFAQFGNGQAMEPAGAGQPTLRSDIVLINSATTGDPVTGSIALFNAAGEELDPGDLFGEDVPAGFRPFGSSGTLGFELAPLGNVTFPTTGLGELVSGSALVTSDGPIAGFIRFDITGIGVAGVRPSSVTNCAVAPVRKAGSLTSGVAIRNTEARDLTVTLRLLDNGSEVENGMTEFVLAPNERVSSFIEQYFEDADVEDFTGTVLIEADGAFAAITLEFDQFVGVSTTLPIATCIRD